MTRRLSITSTANHRLKPVRRLHRRRDRCVFLVEGHRQLDRALASRARVREVYAAPALSLGAGDAALVERAERAGARIIELGPEAFRSISGQARPDGVAAVVERPATALAALRLPDEPLVAVAQGVERPGNLGAIVRTAAAAGVDALLVCDSPTDVFHPDAVRGSVGTLFDVPLAQASSGDVLAWLARHRLRVVVATPAGRTTYREADYGGATAVVVGSERHGVSAAWLEAADDTVAIPMEGPVDSVNVAVAAGIVLFEAVARRREAAAVTAR